MCGASALHALIGQCIACEVLLFLIIMRVLGQGGKGPKWLGGKLACWNVALQAAEVMSHPKDGKLVMKWVLEMHCCSLSLGTIYSTRDFVLSISRITCALECPRR